MAVQLAIEKIEKDAAFHKWKESNKNSFLSYAFTTLESGSYSEWQIGYYNEDTDKMTTFTFNREKIVISPEEEVFKKEKTKVYGLDIKKVEISLEKAIEIAEKFTKKNLPAEQSLKVIITLQNIHEVGQVWNMISMTKSLKIVNVKIDSVDGKILKHSITSAFDFAQKDL